VGGKSATLSPLSLIRPITSCFCSGESVNNELLVREVVNFPVPVIAADLAVSTPTTAANRLTEPWGQVVLSVETGAGVCFQRFHNILENGKINLKNSREKSISGFKALLSRINQQLEHSAKIIELNNPEAT